MLSSRIPYPLTAGFRIRIFNEAKYFKQHGHKVGLLYLGSKEEYNKYKNDLTTVFDKIYFVSTSKTSIFANLIKACLSNKPFQVALYSNKRFMKNLMEIESEYDVVIGNHIRTAEYLKRLDPNKTILDFHDAISYNYANLVKIEKGIKRILYKSEFRRVRDYECNVSKLFKRMVIVSEKDKIWLKKNGASVDNIIVIPVAVRDDILERKTDYKNDEETICFLGKMSYQPNEDAVIWFGQKVFPRLSKKYPNLIFNVLGIEPTQQVIEMSKKNKNIHVTGFVENPYQIMSKAKATVEPIRNGAGVQNKVLESMIIGTPVVASSIAAEGIAAKNNCNILIAKNEEDFYKCVCSLLDSENLRKTIGEAGKAYINENYTWNSLWNRWNRLVTEGK